MANKNKNKKNKLYIIKRNIFPITYLQDISSKSPITKITKAINPKINTSLPCLNSNNNHKNDNNIKKLINVINKKQNNTELIEKLIEELGNENNLYKLPEAIKKIVKAIHLLLGDPIKRYRLGINIFDTESINNVLSISTWNVINEIINSEESMEKLFIILNDASGINIQDNMYIQIIINEIKISINSLNWNYPYIVYDI